MWITVRLLYTAHVASAAAPPGSTAAHPVQSYDK